MFWTLPPFAGSRNGAKSFAELLSYPTTQGIRIFEKSKNINGFASCLDFSDFFLRQCDGSIKPSFSDSMALHRDVLSNFPFPLMVRRRFIHAQFNSNVVRSIDN